MSPVSAAPGKNEATRRAFMVSGAAAAIGAAAAGRSAPARSPTTRRG